MAQRTVLVTGGAGAIGGALADAFLAAGDEVVVGDLDVASARGTRAVALDVTDPDSVARVLDTVGDVDVLVNCAGVLHLHGPVVEFAVADLETIFAVNVSGTYRVTQAVARRMIAAGRSGAIVNVSSIGARQPTRGMGAYEASKAALDAITRWAALELAEHGIRVNAVAPGPVLTPALAEAMPEGSAARGSWTSRIPLGTMASVQDVASAAVYLAGAAHVTGVSLAVDGGQLLT